MSWCGRGVVPKIRKPVPGRRTVGCTHSGLYAQWVVRTVYLAHVLYGLSRPIRKKMWFATPTLGEWGGGKL